MLVMVAVDGSTFGKAAFHTALSIVKNTPKAHMIIIMVVPDFNSYMDFTFGPDVESASIILSAQAGAKKEAERILKDYGHLCKEAKVEATLVIGSGNHVGEVLCKAAEEKKPDMLVVGRRGLGKLKRIFLGSNSRYCIEHAPCSVLVVKKDWDTETDKLKTDEHVPSALDTDTSEKELVDAKSKSAKEAASLAGLKQGIEESLVPLLQLQQISFDTQ